MPPDIPEKGMCYNIQSTKRSAITVVFLACSCSCLCFGLVANFNFYHLVCGGVLGLEALGESLYSLINIHSLTKLEKAL